jgi:hypothetical protein
MMDFGEVGWDDVAPFDLAQDRNRWSSVLNLRVP